MDSVLLLTLLLCGFGIGATSHISKRSECLCRGSKVCPGRCDKCSAGWIPYKGLCYLFDETELNWIQAELYCISKSGNLAAIESKEQYNFLRHIIYKSAGEHKTTWVGGYDAAQENLWLWSKGTKFDFVNWGPGEPSNLRGNQHCMEINFQGQDYVNDNFCDRENSFICVKHP